MDTTEKGILAKNRILSLDQFRGFAIFGMILVNYLGYFERIPETMKHPQFGMIFANAIAPFFLIAVGMGFRMSLKNRIAKYGRRNSYFTAIKRYLVLIIIGIVLYGPDPVCDMWDALVDIGFAGLLTLPFILTKKWIRISLAFLYLIIYQWIFAFTGYGEWTMRYSIDGGPIGILSWASILFFGTVLMDDLQEQSPTIFIKRSLITGFILLTVGYCLSLLNPQELWQFSQRSMTMAYPLFASGLSFIVFVLFYWLADLRKIKIPHLTLLGMNPLILYILQNVLIEAWWVSKQKFTYMDCSVRIYSNLSDMLCSCTIHEQKQYDSENLKTFINDNHFQADPLCPFVEPFEHFVVNLKSIKH